MLFVTHLLSASTLYLTATYTSIIPFSWTSLALILIGSVIPDIDHTKSKVGKGVPFLSYPLQFLFRHRGIVHSVIGLILFTGLLYGTLELLSHDALTYSLWFGIGYLIHLLTDGLTKSGIRLVPGVIVIKGSIQTGGFVEKMITFLLLSTTLIFTALLLGLL